MINTYSNSKYTRWYFQIIERARDRTITEYTEKHHILPKSLGGPNSKENLAILTAREHYVCHRLLVKMTTGTAKAKMIYALCCIIQVKNPNQQGRYGLTSRVYENIRIIIAQNLSERIFSDEYRQKLRDSAQRLPRSPETKRKISEAKKGVPRSEETKQKMRGQVRSVESRKKMSETKRLRRLERLAVIEKLNSK